MNTSYSQQEKIESFPNTILSKNKQENKQANPQANPQTNPRTKKHRLAFFSKERYMVLNGINSEICNELSGVSCAESE